MTKNSHCARSCSDPQALKVRRTLKSAAIRENVKFFPIESRRHSCGIVWSDTKTSSSTNRCESTHEHSFCHLVNIHRASLRIHEHHLRCHTCEISNVKSAGLTPGHASCGKLHLIPHRMYLCTCSYKCNTKANYVGVLLAKVALESSGPN